MLFAILISVIILALSYLYLKASHDYWKKRNVFQAKDPGLLVGNYGEWMLQRKCLGITVHKLLQKYPDEPYVGAYVGNKPVLIIQDPELLKLVLTKDFHYFNSREIMDYTYREPLGSMIFFAHGDLWRVTRQHTTPLFSTAKMKNMFYMIKDCAYLLEDFIQRKVEESSILDAKDVMTKYTIQAICICGFGIDAKSLTEEHDNVFVNIGKVIFIKSRIRGLSIILRAVCPAIFYGLGFRIFSKKITDFFFKLTTSVFERRNYTPTTRNDFVDLVLSLKKNEYLEVDSMKGSGEKIRVKVDDALLVSQCVGFFGAGYETTATTLTFVLYKLADNKHVQDKAIEEVDAYLERHNNKLNYECISELQYLKACTNETLRCFPVLQVITREVVEEYTLPTGVKLERGTRVHIPVYHFNNNPKYFPEPEIFRPERHLNGEKSKIIPYTFLPFGEGPRTCLGKRFATMQSLTGLVTVLKKYRVELADGVPRDMGIFPSSTVSQPISHIHLKFTLRDGWQTRKRFATMQSLTGLVTVLKQYRVELADGVPRDMGIYPSSTVSQPISHIHLKFTLRDGWQTREYDRSFIPISSF